VPASSSAYRGPPGGTPSGCAAAVGNRGFTPNEYLDAYGYTSLQQAGVLGQGERVALIELGGFKASDLNTFAQCFGLNVPPINVTGPSGLLPADGEATLDLEVLDAVAPDLKSVEVYETAPDTASILEAIMEPLQSAGFKPQVISISLGLCESQALKATGMGGINAFESALKVVAATGISVVAASGDSGSAACMQGGSTSRTPIPELAVNFPSSSPWVTSVGGTNISLSPQNLITGQTAWNDGLVAPGYAGGGGESKLFARPSWQTAAFSGTGRAQPDVAMLADPSPGYDIYCTTTDCDSLGWLQFGGTSAATPLLAGGFALIDELLRQHGEQSLGLADPLLYRLGASPTENQQVFNDVTSGTNDIGPFIQQDQQPLGCCSAGPGYDDASGWGGVNLDALSQAALAEQPQIVNVSMTLPAKQHPFRHRGIYADVACSGPCDMSAYVHVRIARGPSFLVYSPLRHLKSASQHTVRMAFGAGELGQIRAALRRHRRITAAVTGAILDSAGNIERRTASRRLVITS
jgi:kumamolisin